MAQKNEGVRAIGKVARILEDLAIADRRDVIAFLAEDHEDTGPARARAAHRIAGALDELTPAARAHVLAFFEAQLAEDEDSKGDGVATTDGLGNQSTIRRADGTERAI